MAKTALIIEDHPLYRGALVQLLHLTLGEQCTHAANCAEDGLRLAKDLPGLSLILLDLSLPGLSGMEALNAFISLCPAVPILVVSANEDRQLAMQVLRAGARVFMSKEVSTDVLSKVVQELLANESTAPQWITAAGSKAMDAEPTASEQLTLTQRQKGVLALLLRGMTNKEIALHLELAEITVKIHVSAIFRVMRVVNRTQAVLAARRLNLLDDASDLI
jgi:DNA-binding NarL/FixJ family response regulator